jgi:hypothetical protein
MLHDCDGKWRASGAASGRKRCCHRGGRGRCVRFWARCTQMRSGGSSGGWRGVCVQRMEGVEHEGVGRGGRTAGETRGDCCAGDGDPACLPRRRLRSIRLSRCSPPTAARHSAAAASLLPNFSSQAAVRNIQSSQWPNQRTNSPQSRSRGRRATRHSPRSTRRRSTLRWHRSLRAVYVTL